MNIVLIGRTGSGKTTVARQLHERTKIPLVSSGDVARALSESDPTTDLALKQGALAPEQAMRSEIRRLLEAAEIQSGGWILDGFPRSIGQLICLRQWTDTMPLFFHVELNRWDCIERLVQRGRVDDNPDSIARKFESYESKTQPMIDLLENGGVLHTVFNDFAPEDATSVILQIISNVSGE